MHTQNKLSHESSNIGPVAEQIVKVLQMIPLAADVLMIIQQHTTTFNLGTNALEFGAEGIRVIGF